MARHTEFVGIICKEYCSKYPNISSTTLARLIVDENSEFKDKDLERLRSRIRVYRGVGGTAKRNQKKFSNFIPKSYKTDYTPFFISQSKTLILSDLHIPYHDEEAISLAIQYGIDNEANCILINGDLTDFADISRHERDWRMRSTVDEIEATRFFLEGLRESFPTQRIVYKYGNHCFDTETEILTKEGWKKYDEISYFDDFATYKSDTGEIEYHKAENIHRLNYAGKMFKIQTRSIDMLVTEYHRLFIKYGSRNSEYGNFQVLKASELNTSSPRVSFMSAGMLNNPEYSGITDDEIRLCAWIHTDGSIYKKENQKPKYILYQRQSKVGMITDILNRLGYDYSLDTRDRLITSICGKQLKKRNDKSCTITIKRGRDKNNNDHRLDEIIHEKYVLPSWIHNLSQRQFDVFLESLIDGDGTRHINSKNSSAIYGIKSFLDQIHAHLVVRGYRSSLSEYRKNTFRLNILHSRDYVDIDKFKNNNQWVDYSGQVFCVTVPNGLVVVRRNGKVHISGNCERWDKYVHDNADQIADLKEFELEVVLRLRENDIEVVKDKRPIRIGKLTVLHGHELAGGSGGVNPARATFLKTLNSVIVGHYHKTSSHTETTMNGDVISVESQGCLCGLNPLYMPINKHNLGFSFVEMDIKSGEYHLHNKKIIKGKIY